MAISATAGENVETQGRQSYTEREMCMCLLHRTHRYKGKTYRYSDIHISVSPSPYICLSVCLSLSLCLCQPVCLPICPPSPSSTPHPTHPPHSPQTNRPLTHSLSYSPDPKQITTTLPPPQTIPQPKSQETNKQSANLKKQTISITSNTDRRRTGPRQRNRPL